MPRPLRPALLVVLAALGSSAGCLRAYNPTYFPNWGYGGDVLRTHAKPTGGAYFRNYDPKAVRIDVTPTVTAARPGTQQVLVATVFDKDGQPRRSRRVEWMIDGPGFIVEVDESGWWAGRGYKVDNKYAVSHTDYKEHCVTRGNDDPRDDFTIHPGQTWCVVSSAVEGLTTVTAYAPEVFDWQCGRVTAKISWADTQFVFPPPVISRSGGEIDLTTAVRRLDGKESPDGLHVRYRVLDGPAASVVSRSADATTVSRTGAGDREAEVPADADGKATVKVVQPSPQAGKTRVSVEVVKPDPNGTGPGTVVGQQVTSVEWAAPDLKVEVGGQLNAGVGRETTLTLTASNPGKADSGPVTVRCVLPDGIDVVSTVPERVADRYPTKELRWAVGAVLAGQSQTVRVTVRPSRTGSLPLAVTADTEDGLRAAGKGTLTVGTSALKLTAETPGSVGVGDKFNLQLAVSNPGSSPAENVTAWVTTDGAPQEVPVGTIPAGQTKKVDVPLTATAAGRLPVKVTATADGGLSDKAETGVDVKKTGLTVSVVGPEQVSLGEEATWEVRLTNTGEVPLSGATAKASVPAGLTPRGATDWPVSVLAPGAKTVLKLTAAADKLLDSGAVAVTVAAGDAKGSTLASGQAPVAVVGKPALLLELTDSPTTVAVGQRGEVRITVRNRGTGPAKKVDVLASVSDSLTLVGGTGADRKPALVDGAALRFRVLDELPPGMAAVLVAEVEATKPGAARLSVEVRAEHLSQPLRDEQSARVVSGK